MEFDRSVSRLVASRHCRRRLFAAACTKKESPTTDADVRLQQWYSRRTTFGTGRRHRLRRRSP
jgi:hypothetical protein